MQSQEPTFSVESHKRLHYGRIQPCLQIFDQGGCEWQSQTLKQLFMIRSNHSCKKFYSTGSFYGRNFLLGRINQSVCAWKAFPAQSNICEQGQEPTLEWSTFQAFHLGRLRPFSQTLDQVGRACQGQSLQIITNICNFGTEKVLQHWNQVK